MPGLVALALAYVLSQFYRSFLAVLTPALSMEIGATKATLSVASGAWFLAFALMQFIVGVSLDRFGPRRTASLLLGLCGGGGAFLFAAATDPQAIIAAMTLIGIGCAPVLMATLFIFAKTFPPARFAVLTSWFVAFGSLGNVVGTAPLAAAAEAAGWRVVMAALGVATLVVAAAIWFLTRDPAREDGHAGGFSGYGELLRIKVLWPLIPLTAVNYAPAVGIRGLWAGPFLADVHAADALSIGNVTLFMALGMVAGGFLYGPLDTLFRTRKWVNAAGNAISVAALSILAAFLTAGLSWVGGILVVIGISGASYGMLMAHARSFFPPHLTGRGVTLMNFFSIGGVGAMQFATGAVVTAATMPGEPAAAYQALFAFYAAVVALALAIYLFARDAKP